MGATWLSCHGCGISVWEGDEHCPNCGREIEYDLMCPNCDEKLDDPDSCDFCRWESGDPLNDSDLLEEDEIPETAARAEAAREQAAAKAEKEKAARQGNRWTGDEESTLLRLFKDGIGVDEISKAMGRTPNAVNTRLHHLRGNVLPSKGTKESEKAVTAKRQKEKLGTGPKKKRRWHRIVFVVLAVPIAAAYIVDACEDKIYDGCPKKADGSLDCSYQDLSGERLRELDFSGADFSGANLKGANFYEADLRNANLSRADLKGTNLSWADLKGANLSGLDLSEEDMFGGADLSGANLSGANLSGSDLRDVNFSGSDLRGADLRGADFSGGWRPVANLSGADLRDANLSGADLKGTNLKGANLAGVDLSGANLSESDLTGALLYRGTADANTEWPEGFYPEAAGVIFVDSYSDGEVLAILTARYSWGDSALLLGARHSGVNVSALQEVLGITVDGWYGVETRNAHLAELKTRGYDASLKPVSRIVPTPPVDADPHDVVRADVVKASCSFDPAPRLHLSVHNKSSERSRYKITVIFESLDFTEQYGLFSTEFRSVFAYNTVPISDQYHESFAIPKAIPADTICRLTEVHRRYDGGAVGTRSEDEKWTIFPGQEADSG